MEIYIMGKMDYLVYLINIVSNHYFAGYLRKDILRCMKMACLALMMNSMMCNIL